VELARSPGFSWRAFGDSPFSSDHSDRLIDLSTVLNALRRQGAGRDEARTVIHWEPEDPRADLFTVLFGALPEGSEHSSNVKRSIETVLSVRELLTDSEVPPDLNWLDSALALGMWNVDLFSEFARTGVVVVDPDSVSDLVDFWNLRALGNLVVPWPLPDDPTFAEFVRLQLETLPRRRWAERDPDLTVFTRIDEMSDGLRAVLPISDVPGVIRSPLDFKVHSQFTVGIGSQYRTAFDVAVAGERATGESIRVPLPRTDLIPSDPTYPWQYCAARITIYSESQVRERSSFRAPGIRLLAPFVQLSASPVSPVVRGVGDGVVVACRPTDHDVDLGAIDSVSLIARLLSDAGFTVRLSDAGLWSAQILDALGGASSTLASQPAVREVLDLAARDRGATPSELRGAAARHCGAWSEHFALWLRERPYEEWVLGMLAAQRLIEPVFEYRCPGCGLKQGVSAEDVAAILHCEVCGSDTPLALQVVLRGKWRLKTRRLLDRSRLRSIYPLLSTLRLLLDVSTDTDTFHYSVGLILRNDDREFEVDFVALVHDARGPALVVGECKARGDLESGDVDNLEAVQDAVRQIGVEVFIAVANSKEALAPAEVARLRRSAERNLWSLLPSSGLPSYKNLPLVLTREPLTLHEGHPDHALEGRGSRRGGLADLAVWTCKRELGLTGFRGPPGDEPAWD
jgi:hypothetical protein